MSEYFLDTLNNGIRVAHLPYKSNVAYCGIVVNCGSSNESETEHGIVHFIEHMLFKGTQKRKNVQIINRLENIGGEINAYTTKEETFIYCAIPSEYLSRAAELLADITFCSTFPSGEIDKEKDVIIDEINSYKDSPYESIHDDFEDLVFENHSLGHNILGTKESIETFTQEVLYNFTTKNYHTDQMVFFVMGNYTFNRVKKVAQKYFEEFEYRPGNPSRNGHFAYTPVKKTDESDTYQAHFITGNIAPGIHEEERHVSYLLNNILAGPGMNSRLNLSLREKNGIAYNIESNYTPFTSTGLISIYFGSDHNNLKRSERIINKELKLLRDKALTTTNLNKYKKQLIGQLYISSENRENHFLTFGKSILHYNDFNSLTHIIERIDKISPGDILHMSNKLFTQSELSQLIIL